MHPRQLFVYLSVTLVVLLGLGGAFYPPLLLAFVVVGPAVLLGYYDFFQTKRTLLRNFPLLGRGRYLMEVLRPPVQQYFVESDLGGTPLNRMFRSVVYQRAKKVLDTKPFGTDVDVYRPGYEWTNHSLSAIAAHELEQDPRVSIGGPDCTQPYECSLLNVSAMSFGALSENAIRALNGGAKIGGFAHNTGEGGLSPHHLEPGGDLIWQIGTAYFGCRTNEGVFDPEVFAEKSKAPSVKMIEIKLSQGAKPGHGGILPAAKNSPEIAEMRGVEPHTTVLSPPTHSAFATPDQLLAFVDLLRRLSGGKPVGFKLCVGSRYEFVGLVRAMHRSGITPDFITVDGGEGGTGAAPLEFSNSVGMPLREGLTFAHDVLVGYGLRDRVKIAASGKILTGFHVLRALALGADVCYSARGMMLALGCIQALECNKNNCPTGVATQDKELMKGLVVSDKRVRVANFHQETVRAFVELLGATGLASHEKVNRTHVYRRVSSESIRRYDEIYPPLKSGALLEEALPEAYRTCQAECDRFEEKMAKSSSTQT